MGIIDSKIVLVTDINVGGGEGTSKMIADAGGEAMFHACDTTYAGRWRLCRTMTSQRRA